MAHYYISGVWKNAQEEITHVYIHLELPHNTFASGKKVTVNYAINLLRVGHTAQVMTWSYTYAGWYAEDFVKVVNANPPYLRSHKNNTVNDNLDNLINYQAVVY